MELVIATRNKGKIAEIASLFSGQGSETLAGIKVLTLDELGIGSDIEEDGETFEANAVKKAVEYMKLSGRAVLADDSGLEIDALGGRPGVYSARFFGHDTPYAEKHRRLLEMLQNETHRQARFRSVIAVAFTDGRVLTASGALEGEIAREPAGEGGFGYDPVFYLPEYRLTLAQISREEKNKISHRGKALAEMIALLSREAHLWT